jgi:hypothetical protein
MRVIDAEGNTILKIKEKSVRLTLLTTDPLMLATRTILPSTFRFIISLATVLATINVPATLISITLWKVFIENSVDGPLSDTPAQATRPHNGQRSFGTNLAKAASTASSCVTLQDWYTIEPL